MHTDVSLARSINSCVSVLRVLGRRVAVAGMRMACADQACTAVVTGATAATGG